MNNSIKPPDIPSGRRRLSELRERKRASVSKSIGNSRTTVIINMIINITSGIIFAVGLFYVMRFLNMRRPYMDPMQYRIFIWAFIFISCGWFAYLVLRVRRHIKRLREISSRLNR